MQQEEEGRGGHGAVMSAFCPTCGRGLQIERQSPAFCPVCSSPVVEISGDGVPPSDDGSTPSGT